MENDFSALVDAVNEYEKIHLPEKRHAHCVRVAELSRKMADIYGVNPEKAYFAGLTHDICKWMDKDSLVEFCKDDGYGISSVVLGHPSLLHGRAGALVLKNEFGINDLEVLEAVARHVSGAKNLSPLGRIVYSADKIEPGRKWVSDEYLNAKLSKSLNEMALEVVEEIVGYLNERGGTLEEETVDYIKFLKSEINKA